VRRARGDVFASVLPDLIEELGRLLKKHIEDTRLEVEYCIIPTHIVYRYLGKIKYIV
jgi:hypothetical protein